jgi:4-oxalocrotonate tautomerase
MPALRLQVAPLQNPDRYRLLAAALTRLMADLLHKDASLTAVLIEDLPAGRWLIAGADVRRPTALLEANITAGTNTAEEKSAFIAAAHAELQRQLAPSATLEEASYVIVREIPAGDWGYAGLTQRERQLQRLTLAA